MLTPAPYEVPEKKAKKKAPGTRSGLRHNDTSGVTSEDSKTQSSTKVDEEEEEEEEIHPPYWGRKNRKASTHGGAKASKKGKTSLPDNSAADTNSGGEWEPRAKPLANL